MAVVCVQYQDGNMLPRQSWIAAFIGHALRNGHTTDPDWTFDAALELYPELRELDPAAAADSAFVATEMTPNGPQASAAPSVRA